MNCPDEIALTGFCDGELVDDARAAIEHHLTGCARCRDLLAALQQENSVLVQALQETPVAEVVLLPIPDRRPVPARNDVRVLGWGLAAAAAIALAIGGHAIERALSGRLDLAQSLATSVALRSLIDGIFAVAEGGTAMLSSVQFAVIAIVAGLLMIAALRRVWQRRLFGSSLLVALGGALLVLPTAAQALEARDGDIVTIAADETVAGPILLTGKEITVAGTVDSDLFAFGNRVVVSGTVRGNLFAAGKTVDVTGQVIGSQHVAAQNLSLAGETGGNVYAAGQDVALRQALRVSRDAVTAGETITVDGSVGNDLTMFGETATVGGQVGRDLDFDGGTLRVTQAARVGRDVRAAVDSEDRFQLDAKAAVVGTRDFKVHVDDADHHDDDRPFVSLGFYSGLLLRLIAALVVALLLFVLAPALVAARPQSGQPVLKQLGIGFLWLVATPIGAIILAITVIGIPLALAGGLLYAIALYLAGIEVALAIGQLLVRDARRSFGPWALAALLGLLIVLVARALPVVGGVVTLLVLCWGLGLLYQQAIALYRAARMPAQPVSPA